MKLNCLGQCSTPVLHTLLISKSSLWSQVISLDCIVGVFISTTNSQRGNLGLIHLLQSTLSTITLQFKKEGVILWHQISIIEQTSVQPLP